jgi:predicted porin
LGGLAVAAANVRVDNAITLQTAKFSGLSAAYQYAFGEVAGDTAKTKTEAFNLDYTQGNLRVNYSHVERKDSSGVRAERGDFTYASYNLGFAKPVIGYIETEGAAGSVKNKVTLVGASVPVNAKTTALLGYYDHKNAGNTANKDGQTYSLGATYALSNRTTLYALTAFSNVDAGTVLAVSNTGTQHNQANNVPAGLNQSVYAVGIRHTF